MAADPMMDRIFSKLDAISEKIGHVREEASADRQMLASHLSECASRNAVIHKRIDDIKAGQRWWTGKLITAGLGGGGLGAWLHELFKGRG